MDTHTLASTHALLSFPLHMCIIISNIQMDTHTLASTHALLSLHMCIIVSNIQMDTHTLASTHALLSFRAIIHTHTQGSHNSLYYVYMIYDNMTFSTWYNGTIVFSQCM